MSSAQKKKRYYSPEKRQLYQLKKCYSSPSSLLCRRRVHGADDETMVTLRNGDVVTPKNGSLMKADLMVNKRGKVVSRKKSVLMSTKYQKDDNGLRQWNEDAKAYRKLIEKQQKQQKQKKWVKRSAIKSAKKSAKKMTLRPRPKKIKPGDYSFHG